MRSSIVIWGWLVLLLIACQATEPTPLSTPMPSPPPPMAHWVKSMVIDP